MRVGEEWRASSLPIARGCLAVSYARLWSVRFMQFWCQLTTYSSLIGFFLELDFKESYARTKGLSSVVYFVVFLL